MSSNLRSQHRRHKPCTQSFGLLQCCVRRTLPVCNIQRLQSVLSAAVRLVTNASRRDHITPLFRDRHWLPIKQRVVASSRLQAVYDGASLSARTGSILLGRTYYAACSRTYQRGTLRSAKLRTVAVPRTHRRQRRRGCRGHIPTNILVGGDVNGNIPTKIFTYFRI